MIQTFQPCDCEDFPIHKNLPKHILHRHSIVQMVFQYFVIATVCLFPTNRKTLKTLWMLYFLFFVSKHVIVVSKQLVFSASILHDFAEI